MENAFNNFEYIIKEGIKNNMPEMSKILILGQMHYAMGRGDLTIRQVEELEAMLGYSLKNYKRELEYALAGSSEEDDVAA
jgi:hypothetical protein